MRSTIIGIIIGIVMFIIVLVALGFNIFGKVVDDYSDEYESAREVLKSSKDPVLQKDYIIAGLTLSPDFQHYLEEGVKKGWWTEEFLTQVFLDDLLPIYANQYSATFKAIKNSLEESGKLDGIKELIPKIKGFLSKLDINQIKTLISKIRNILLSLDFSKIILTLQNIRGFLSKLDLSKLTQLIATLKGFLGNLNIDQIKEKLNNLKVLIGNLKDTLGDLFEKIDIEKLQDLINKVVDFINNLDQETIDKIKDFLENLDLEKIQELIEKILDFLDDLDLSAIQDKLNDLIDDVGVLIEKIREIIANIQASLAEIIDFLENLVDNIYAWLIADVDADFDFNRIDGMDGAVDGNITIGGNDIPITLLNGADLYINYYIDDQGTTSGPGNKNDDEITIQSVTITFERFMSGTDGGGLRYVVPLNGGDGKTLANSVVYLTLRINQIIDIVNSKI